MSAKKNNKLSKTALLLALVAIIILVATYFIYQSSTERTTKPAETSPEIEQKINLEPPTEQEMKDTEDNKANLNSEKNPVRTPAQFASTITPIITSSDMDTIRAYISGISEDGGLCTATFNKDNFSFTKQSSAFRDVNTTVCEPIQLQRSDFATSGEWTVVLTYVSSLAQGKSKESKFTVN